MKVQWILQLIINSSGVIKNCLIMIFWWFFIIIFNVLASWVWWWWWHPQCPRMCCMRGDVTLGPGPTHVSGIFPSNTGIPMNVLWLIRSFWWSMEEKMLIQWCMLHRDIIYNKSIFMSSKCFWVDQETGIQPVFRKNLRDQITACPMCIATIGNL